MNIPQEHINTLRPVNNLVLVEPIVKPDEVQYKSLKLYLDTRFDRSSYQPVVCRVISCCKQVIYDPVKIQHEHTVYDPVTRKSHVEYSSDPRYPNTMPWKCERQIKYDDIVWINYYPIVRAEDEKDENVIVYTETKKYFLIHYSELYCLKRGNDIIMLNGWILCKPLSSAETEQEKRMKELGLFTPSHKEKADDFGLVYKIGLPVDDYCDSEQCGEDDDHVQEGDIVKFAMQHNRHLEQSSYHKWFDGTDYIISRRRNLLGILTPEKVN